MTHYVYFPSVGPACGSFDASEDTFNDEPSRVTCPRCLAIMKATPVVHMQGLGFKGRSAMAVCDSSISLTAETATTALGLVTCLRCRDLIVPKDNPTDSPAWPTEISEHSFDHKECIIADRLLNRIHGAQTKWEAMRLDDLARRVGDYLAFQQAVWLRQKLKTANRNTPKP